MFVYTIQPVVKPVVKPVREPVVSCKWSHAYAVMLSSPPGDGFDFVFTAG